MQALLTFNKIKNKGEMILYNNILEKLNFNVEEIKLFDSFAGIGSLHQSLKELGVPVKLTGISEINVDAIISYASIHINNFKDLKITYPTDEEIKTYLIDRNIGYDFDKQKSSIQRMRKDKLKLCYKACILTNNMGDVSSLDFDKIPDSDLFNFSFPCTNVSNAGKQEGFTKEDGSITHSGLYIYGIKAIKAKKFKYIMIENVKGLIQKKFVNDFYSIIKEIESLGYHCYYPKKKENIPTCLNAKNYGTPQNRERIFVICIRNDIDKNNFQFPIGKDYGIRLKDLLEDTVNEKYYLSQEIQDRFKLNGSEDVEHNELNVVGSSAPDFRTIGQRDMTYGVNGIMSTLTATDYKQPKQIIDEKYYLKDTKDFFIKNSFDMEAKGNGFRFEPHVKDNANTAKTITTRAGSRMDDNYIIDIKSDKEKFVFDSTNNELNQVGMLDIKGNEQIRRVYDSNGLSPTLNTMQGGNRQLKILENEVKKLFDIPKEIINDNERQRRVYSNDGISPTVLSRTDSAKILEENSLRFVGGIDSNNTDKWIDNGKELSRNYKEGYRVYDSEGIATCQKTNGGGLGGNTGLYNNQNFKIRKLTPKECWRLMGFRDEHIDRVKELGISDSSLYKQAGNSIVVNVLYYIFKELFKEYIV